LSPACRPSSSIELTEDAVERPELAVRRQWTLDEEHFRPTDDRETATSTYLETWPQAVKWIREAVVDGIKLVQQNGRPPIKLHHLP
jgi:hypothetical protein